MELAGLIVRTLPGHLERVETNLLAVPGIEIHHIDPNGRMIVTLEHDTHKALSNSISLLQDVDKVLAISLVYQHSEELEDTASNPDSTAVNHDSITASAPTSFRLANGTPSRGKLNRRKRFATVRRHGKTAKAKQTDQKTKLFK